MNVLCRVARALDWSRGSQKQPGRAEAGAGHSARHLRCGLVALRCGDLTGAERHLAALATHGEQHHYRELALALLQEGAR